MIWLVIKLLIKSQKPQELHQRLRDETEIQEIYVFLQKREKTIDDVRLIWQYKNGISINNKLVRWYSKSTI